jgi:hypothetical protein
VAVGAATLPQRWTRPVVDSVLLPVHAQATGGVFGGAGLGVTGGGMFGMVGETHYAQGPAHRLLDAVIPSAHAGTMVPSEPTATVCAILSGNMMTVQFQRSQNNAFREGTLNIDGTPGTLNTTDYSMNCEGAPIDLNAQIVNYTSSGFYLHFIDGETDVTMYYMEVYVPLTGSCPSFAPLDGTCTARRA